VNPEGHLPSLRTAAGVLTGMPALQVFVAQNIPQAGLAPVDDDFALARPPA
jgi:glutathione S-transferase